MFHYRVALRDSYHKGFARSAIARPSMLQRRRRDHSLVGLGFNPDRAQRAKPSAARGALRALKGQALGKNQKRILPCAARPARNEAERALFRQNLHLFTFRERYRKAGLEV